MPEGAASYELTAPKKVALLSKLSGDDKMEIRYTLDGTEPSISSKRYESPFVMEKNCTLKAGLFSGGKMAGCQTLATLSFSQEPSLGLLGIWSASKTSPNAIINQITGKAGDLPLVEGTEIQDDPEQGKIFVLDHSSPIVLSHPAILENHLTLVFRIQPSSPGSLISETYGPKGIFADINSGMGLHSGGGGSYNVASSSPNVMGDGKWHTVAVTFGGTPTRGISLYIDGKEVASGRSPVPCLQPQLTLLPGYSGKISEIRIYNRILNPEEILSLSNKSK
jgi:hypothetical protein